MFSLPWGFLVGVNDLEQNDIDYEEEDKPSTISICSPSFGYESNIRNYFIILFLIQYLLPLLVLCVTFFMITYYVKIINANTMKADDNKSNKYLRKKNEKKLLKIQILMIVCFNICWLPLQLNAFIYSISPEFQSSIM